MDFRVLSLNDSNHTFQFVPALMGLHRTAFSPLRYVKAAAESWRYISQRWLALLMRRHDEVDRFKSYEFDVLLDAVLYEPHKVKDIVTANRDCLWAVNYSGENVLHWLAVENHVEGVTQLRALGSPIPEFALIHALEAGHTEMVILLLELGANPSIETCKRSLENPLWELSDKTKRIMRSYFKQYGYEI